MNFDSLNDWRSIKGRLLDRYPNLTNKDLTYTRGGEHDFLQRLHERTGESRESLRRIIEEDDES